jgi:hypothetical protein
MKKTEEEKIETRILGFASADRVEWEHTLENPDLRADIIKLQNEYILPLRDPSELSNWLAWFEPVEIDSDTGELILGLLGQRRENLFKDVKELAGKYGIDPKWLNELMLRVINDSIGWHISPSNGFPTLKWRKNNKGERIHECIITPETDLENPAVLGLIKTWQAIYRSTPPQPQKNRGNPKKLDWRLVWEWRKRHPNVTYEKIANQLHRDPTSVRKILERLDKES